MFPSSLFYIARVTKNEKILFTTLKLCVNILDLQLSDLVKTKFDKKIEQYRDWETDRKSTRLNSSHRSLSRMPSSA